MPSRVDRLRQSLSEAGLDAVLIAQSTNRRYMSGFAGSAGVLLISGEHARLLVDFRYVQQARQQAPDFEVVMYQDVYQVLKDFRDQAGWSRIGFEAAHVSYKEYQKLRSAVPDAEWAPTEDLVERLRAVKDPEEIERIRKAVVLADRAYEHILPYLRPGAVERDIGVELESFMLREGADGISFPPIVASGPRGAFPHARPTDRVLQAGEFVTLDLGAVVNGYCSDMTRTVFLGEPQEKDKEIYELVLRAQVAGVDAVRPGVKGQDVDGVARSIIQEAGYGENFGHGLGHGVGMDVHEEYPRLNPRGQVVLEPGMVASVEPGIYIPDWGGIRIEDLVLVTETGCEILSASPKELLALPA